MTEDIVTRMTQLVRSIAKDCDCCGKHSSAFCDTCWGNVAKGIVKDIDFKPLPSNHNQDEILDIFSKLDSTGYCRIPPLARECGMSSKRLRTILKRLECEGLVDTKDNKWVRRKQDCA